MLVSSLKAGVTQATRTWQLTLILVIASMIFALPVAVPFVSTIIQTTVFRPTGKRLLADTLDPLWLIDFANEQFAGTSLTAFITQFTVTFLVMAFGFLISNVILAGGVLDVLTSEDRSFSMKRFFSGAGAYWWRFLRLWGISIAVYGAVFFAYLIAMAVIDGYEETAAAEGPIVISKWIATLALAAVFAFVNMTFGYARIATVLHGSSSMIRETALAISFVLRHLLRTNALYISVLAVGFMAFGVFAGLRGLVNQGSLSTAILALLIGQLAIAGRVWARVVNYAAAMELYRALTPKAEAEPEQPGIKLTPEFAAAIHLEP
jgi:hypothetical protein